MTENEAIQEIKKIYVDTNQSDECIALKMAISALLEIQKYKEIGTVEEFREAREKQKAKKYKKIHPCKSVNYYQCPCCNGLLHMNENFCGDCGQSIFWEDEECPT